MTSLTPKMILVIEPDDNLRHTADELLREIGFDAVSETNGHSGLSRIELERRRKQPIHGVLMSLGLRIFPSLAVLAELRQTYPALPVIVMAPRDPPNLLSDAWQCGATGHVTVPFNLESFNSQCLSCFGNPTLLTTREEDTPPE